MSIAMRSGMIILFGGIALFMGAVYAQTYPDRPVRIVTGPAGGDNDTVARAIATGIAGALGQTLVVDNRASTGVVPIEAVAKSKPDGYTILVIGSSLWTVPLIQKTPYDPIKDFAPITMTTMSPNVLVVHPSLPAKSVKELIALAKAKPGQLNYSSGVIGGFSHLAAELFKSMTGTSMQQVVYKGSAGAVNALLIGEVELAFGGVAPVTPQVKAGRMRALAVTSAEPSALFPGLPTMAAAGVPGYEAVLSLGMLAPAGTPGAIITRLNQETVRLLKSPEIKARFLSTGVETVGNTPDQFAAAIKSEMTRLEKVVKDAGIKVE